MATSEVTPNVAAVSDGASGASPATSAPASSAPVQGSTPAAQPSTSPTPSAPKMNPGEDPYAFLQRVRKEREGQKPAETPAAEVKPVVEEKPAEGKPEEVKAEEKPAESQSDESPTEEIEPELSLAEQKGPIPPQELAQKWTPEVEQALSKVGIGKNEMFAMSRLASKATKYDEIFTDFEQAKFAAEQADTFSKADDLFTNIKAAASEGQDAQYAAIDQFMGLLLQLDQQLDAEGNPLVDPKTGAPVLQGNAQAFIQGLRDMTWSQNIGDLRKQAESTGNEELATALDILEQHVKGSAGQEDESEAVKAERARLNAEKQDLARQREQAEDAKHQEFENAVRDASRTKYDAMISTLVGQTDLTDGFKKVATDMIIKGLAERLSNDPKYKAEREALARLPYGDGARTKRIALNERYGKAILKQVAEPVFKELGAKVISKQQATQQKVAAQVEASKAEPKGSTASAAPATVTNPAEALAQWKQDYIKKNGREPDPLDMIKFRRSLGV